VHGLQGEVLAGELSTECGREHGLRRVADAQDVLLAQLIGRQVARHVDTAEGQDGLENHLDRKRGKLTRA